MNIYAHKDASLTRKRCEIDYCDLLFATNISECEVIGCYNVQLFQYEDISVTATSKVSYLLTPIPIKGLFNSFSKGIST